MPHLDFWRMDPRGMFYAIRGLEDDVASGRNGPPPLTQLDFLLQISRVSEIISTGLSFARSMGCDETHTKELIRRYIRDRALFQNFKSPALPAPRTRGLALERNRWASAG